MADLNVSAFAAYHSFIDAVASPAKQPAAPAKQLAAAPQASKKKQQQPQQATKKPTAAAAAAAGKAASKPAPAKADASFSKLSHDEMIARLINNKKQELKRKLTDEPLAGAEQPTAAKKPTKRNKGKARSATASANTSAEAAAGAATAAGEQPKKTHPIRIHPKNTEELSLYLSKKTNKRNTKASAANTPVKSAASKADQVNNVASIDEVAASPKPAPTTQDESVLEFVDLVQSTPFVGNGSQNVAPHTNGHASANKRSAKRKEQHVLNGTPSQALVKVEPKNPAPSSAPQPPLSDVSSIEAAKNLLAWIVHPTPIEQFLSDAWEKTPLLIDRKCPTYYAQLLSTDLFDRMLREQRVEFTKNLDITSYVDGVRKTLNPEGRAQAPTVWDFYAQGCSIRLLNPQTFLPVVHSLNATLQEYFQCMTGANVYLTPANSQGFAPHYDDIEAFVLQVEGRKHWKVYKPRTAAEQLPRDSSPNFEQSELGKPILDVVLEAGDLLYFPRGFIHQANTVPGFHSMHITLSAYQKNAYADLLEQLVPAMLQSTIEQSVLLRRGLPADIWQCMGLVHSDVEEGESAAAALRTRKEVVRQLRACLDLTLKSLEEHVDDAVDKLAVRFQHDALPPHLTAAERARTVYGTAAQVGFDGQGGAVGAALPGLETPLRLLRANVLRLVRHSAEEFRVYYSADNSREYHELEPVYVEISAEDAPAVEFLVKTYPAFTRPVEWPIEEEEGRVGVAQDLWERGLLLAQEPLEL